MQTECKCEAGEKLTEDELAEHLSTLLGDSKEPGSLESAVDEESAVNVLETLPETIDADVFINDIMGFSDMRNAADNGTSVNPRPSSSKQ